MKSAPIAPILLLSLLLFACADGPVSETTQGLSPAPEGPALDPIFDTQIPAPASIEGTSAGVGCADFDYSCICEHLVAHANSCGIYEVGVQYCTSQDWYQSIEEVCSQSSDCWSYYSNYAADCIALGCSCFREPEESNNNYDGPRE